MSSLGLDYNHLEPRTSTIDALPLCKHWFQECGRSHEVCKKGLKYVLPTRMIDLSGKEPRIRLAEELETHVEYAALSHCWGSLEFLRLTTKTFGSFRQRIPFEALPKTFQDAIYIARYLGLFYLWIDSLCILQDSAEDWEKECGLMTEVYGACALNIAATAAEDASVGCFFNRKNTWRCQASPSSTGRPIYDCYSYIALLPKDRLGERAWVVQERYLSRRTLHFSENQVFWECGGNSACEIYPSGYPSCVTEHQGSFVLPKHQLSIERWARIVGDYSKGNLTKSSDKLIALGGIARIIQNQTQDQYIAGMWRENLEDQLNWSRFYACGERITPYTAPTWSWASLKGCISYPEYKDIIGQGQTLGRLCIDVHEVQVQYASTNRFGAIKEASLRLRCDFLYSGVIEVDFEGWKTIHIDRHTITHPEPFICFDCLNVDDKDETSFVNTYILPIRTGGARSTGLLLEPTGRKKGQYRRLGYYSVEEVEHFAKGIKTANLVTLKWASHFAETLKDKNGTRQWFIDLV